ncbi:BspA family leucine-rich repeat surface protein [Hoylesella buccalis]|uniref:BspA family leucine-rich repeat surface protein n=1 Tax=Hoylesella buccalis TaxID=28127 RepID=UPI001D150C70|nr:BspA family leucine-rich repeat surface protein [Hoylesella buccalis]UEA63061.1 BspA family leucine-rich repeat surface protein [Hoylesella buccalis]UWP49649.1 BspA family leucine-rich repeat surface protein [Hoylesella buccalis ATCC 35310]
MNNEMCGCNGTCGSEEKTSTAKGIVRINYKEDFELVVELLAGDKPYKLGDEDFRIDFIVMASRYTVGRTGGICERCAVDGNKIRCFMDRHGLPPGELRAEVKVNNPDPNYANGSRLSVAIAEGVVVLVKDNTRFDGAVVKANIPVALVDAFQLAKAHGYKGTIDEYYATFNDIGHLKENIKGTLDEMKEAEKLRATAETERAKAETERQSNRDKFNTAEGERVKNEQQRQNSEEKREQAEVNRFTAENYRKSAEEERLNAEQRRNSTEQARQTAEDQRRKNEIERFASENARFKWEEGRKQAEKQRQTAEEQRKQAETERVNSETVWKEYEEAIKRAERQRNATETERVAAEKQRNSTEVSRKKNEQQRQTNEDARQKAEKERATAEGKRADIDKERDELVAKMQAAWQEIERMKKLREGEYGKEIELVEKIKNAAKIPTQNVWLDATNGQIKSTPASEGINANAYKYYYIGRREVVGNGGRFTNRYLRSLDLSNWDTQSLSDASYMFKGCSSLQSIDVSNWNTQALKNGFAMFSNCSALQTIDLSNWNTQSLSSTNYMFENCTSLHSIDVSNWNTQSLSDASYMFKVCSSLQSIDVSKWNTQALSNVSSMFENCLSLEKLNFRNVNFNKVTRAKGMFYNCNALEELWLPLTFDLLTSIDLSIPNWGATPEGLASLRRTFGEGADDRTAKGLHPCTVRLHENVYDRLTDNERAAAARKGWTITK